MQIGCQFAEEESVTKVPVFKIEVGIHVGYHEILYGADTGSAVGRTYDLDGGTQGWVGFLSKQGLEVHGVQDHVV